MNFASSSPLGKPLGGRPLGASWVPLGPSWRRPGDVLEHGFSRVLE